MALTAEKIDTIDQKIQDLQLKKRRYLEKLDKERLVTLSKLGLFELSHAEMCGMIIETLLHVGSKREIWQAQGEKYLNDAIE